MRIGIDIGGTLLKDGVLLPNCLERVKGWIKLGHDIYIISRVNDRDHRHQMRKMLTATGFFTETGLCPDKDVFFVFERREKGNIARVLELDVMIDDRPECLFFMPDFVRCICINPREEDLEIWKHADITMEIVHNWDEFIC